MSITPVMGTTCITACTPASGSQSPSRSNGRELGGIELPLRKKLRVASLADVIHCYEGAGYSCKIVASKKRAGAPEKNVSSRVPTMRKEGEHALDNSGGSTSHVASGLQFEYCRWPDPPAAGYSVGGPDH